MVVENTQYPLKLEVGHTAINLLMEPLGIDSLMRNF